MITNQVIPLTGHSQFAINAKYRIHNNVLASVRSCPGSLSHRKVQERGAAVVRNGRQFPDTAGFPAEHQLARVAMRV